jgi:hypothetical protein
MTADPGRDQAAARKAASDLIGQLGPWPSDQNDTPVTADALTRYLLVHSQVLFDRIGALSMGERGSDAERRWIEAIAASVDAWHAAALAVLALGELPEGKRDEIAQHIWEMIEDGQAAFEWQWEWLTGHGIAPAQLDQLRVAVEAATNADDPPTLPPTVDATRAESAAELLDRFLTDLDTWAHQAGRARLYFLPTLRWFAAQWLPGGEIPLPAGDPDRGAYEDAQCTTMRAAMAHIDTLTEPRP